ncbi:SRPBCC family protein [Mycobacterium sp. HNNTM2301]|uniref:SRPBCC family protein n=1 Tax=Mycobacterium hainanense TaxID=3289775 RepID=UPI0035A63308
MPSRESITVEQLSSATAVSVYDALMDLGRWSDFMPGVSSASWEVRGAPDTAVGGIRRMRIGRGVTRDRIVDGMKPHHQAYTATLPWYQALLLKDYRGDIRIEDRPNGSLIVWTASCTPRIPGIKNLSRTLQQSYAEITEALAREAERRAAR